MSVVEQGADEGVVVAAREGLYDLAIFVGGVTSGTKNVEDRHSRFNYLIGRVNLAINDLTDEEVARDFRIEFERLERDYHELMGRRR